jgi:hypothetical protein
MNINENELLKSALVTMALRDEAVISKQLENAESPSEEFYLKLDEKVKKMIHEHEKHISFKKTITILIAAALLISIFSITAFAGESIKDFFVEVFDTFSILTVNERKDPIINYTVDATYIPNNFILTREKKDITSGLYEWKLDETLIYLSYSSTTNGSLFFDSENSDYTTIILEDFVVHRAEKYNQINAVWTDGKFVYFLSCYGLGWEEMVKIIEGITLTESE